MSEPEVLYSTKSGTSAGPKGFVAMIPNLFTLLNLACGCTAIVFLLQNGLQLVEGENLTAPQLVFSPEAVYLAPLFIGLAAVVDFFDGFLARALGAGSEMGKQLDSLADVVSFGVAPSLIFFQFLRVSVASQPDGMEASMLWLLPAFVLACAGAYRLARFNIDTSTPPGYFRGTPVPSVGLMVASLPLIAWTSNNSLVLSVLGSKWGLYAIIALLSWLMVSNVPMMSNKPRSKTLKGMLPQILVAIIGLLSAFLLGWLCVPVTFGAYVIISVILKKQII